MVKVILKPSTPLDPMFVEQPTPSTPLVGKMVLDGGEGFAEKALKVFEALPPPEVSPADRSSSEERPERPDGEG